jgi:predicted nucleic-acid-binding protein
MIALDTNVLVRFLVEDDAAQSARAARLIDRAIKSEETLFVPDIVLAEVAWVLTRAYDVPKPELMDVLRKLLTAKHLAFASSDVLSSALDGWARGKGDFSDYLVRAQAEARGCDRIATFDRALLKERAFFAP